MEEKKVMNLYQKINKISVEIGVMEKTGRNQSQGYSFIEQSVIVAKVRELCEKYGITIIPATIERRLDRFDVTRGTGKSGVDTHVQVKSEFLIVNSDKPEENFSIVWDGGEAIDSGDKATNKAITASQKYFYMKLFNISDKEDSDLESPEEPKDRKPSQPLTGFSNPVSEAQLNFIKKLAGELGIAPPIVRTISEASELIKDLSARVKDLKVKDEPFETEK